MDNAKTVLIGGLGFLQTTFDFTSVSNYMPYLQFLIAVLTVGVLIKKLFSKNAKR